MRIRSLSKGTEEEEKGTYISGTSSLGVQGADEYETANKAVVRS